MIKWYSLQEYKDISPIYFSVVTCQRKHKQYTRNQRYFLDLIKNTSYLMIKQERYSHSKQEQDKKLNSPAILKHYSRHFSIDNKTK